MAAHYIEIRIDGTYEQAQKFVSDLEKWGLRDRLQNAGTGIVKYRFVPLDLVQVERIRAYEERMQ